jgi:hypothetical protein
MLNPDEIVRAYVGEVYRYRVAVHDQWGCIADATKEVLAERAQIEKDEYELLFAPSMSPESFRRQLEMTHHRDLPLLWRLKTEGEFLLTAVYGIYTMTRAIRRTSNEELNRCVQRAIAAFEKAAPDADLLRHLHVHVDAYIRGEGKDASRLPGPTDWGAVGMTDDGPVYVVGGKLFILSEIAAAAEALAGAIADCTRPR